MACDSIDLSSSRVLVTGGSGFLGSHVVDALGKAPVAAIAAPSRIECDLRDFQAVRSLLAGFQPDVVMHLAAAQGGVAWQKANQATAYLDNSRMMDAIVAASIDCGVTRLVYTASSICYPGGASIPFQEDTLWAGPPEPAHWGYANAKRGGIALLQAARGQHGLQSTVVLPANMYGPRARFDPGRSNVVAATIRRCVEAHERGDDVITCWGTGSPVREFLYVEDAAEGLLRAAGVSALPEPVNLGTGVETTIARLVELVAAAVGYAGEIRWDTQKPDGAARVCMDITRMRTQLGWTPTTDLGTGLKRTIDWWLSSRV